MYGVSVHNGQGA